MKKEFALIILAAGKGTRMNQDKPKVLTELDGVCLIEKLLKSAENIFAKEDIYIVVGYMGQDVISRLSDKYNYVWQKEQLGTGHAVKQCEDILKNKYDNVLILCGDMPFILESTIKSVTDTHIQNKSVITMLTLKIENFQDDNFSYYKFGRIIRNDNRKITKIVEFKDATEEEKQTTEVNPAIYCIKSDWLWENLNRIKNNNNQSEYYLTDLVSLANEDGIDVNSFTTEDNCEFVGINTLEDLENARRIDEARSY